MFKRVRGRGRSHKIEGGAKMLRRDRSVYNVGRERRRSNGMDGVEWKE